MHHVVLIACASLKRTERSRVADLYLSNLFRKNLRYARSLEPDAIHILSAKHGLLSLDQEIEPYNVTLNTMPAAERRAWADRVLLQLEQAADVGQDRFTILAGKRYREHLLPHIRHAEVPMEGLGIGKQLRFLTRALGHE